MLNALWLCATLAQAALLAAYWRAGLHRRFPWWCGMLELRIAGSAVLYSVGRETHPWAYYKVLTALELPMLALIALAVLEATAGTGTKLTRPSWGLSASVSAFVIGGHVALGKWTPMGAVRSVIEAVTAVLLIFIGAVLIQARTLGRAMAYPVVPHVWLVTALLGMELSKRLVITAGWVRQNDAALYWMAASVLFYGAAAILTIRTRPRVTT